MEEENELLAEMRQKGAEMAQEWSERYGVRVIIGKDCGRVHVFYDVERMLEFVLIGEAMLFDHKELGRMLKQIAGEELLDPVI